MASPGATAPLSGYPRDQSTLGRNPCSRNFALAGLGLWRSFSAFAQVPVADLAKPPASATHYIIQSTGGKHGDSWIWTGADGTRMGRESINLRGQVFELDSSGKAGADGMPMSVTVRGVTPQGDAAETFTICGWKGELEESGGCGQRGLRETGVLFRRRAVPSTCRPG